MSAPIFKVGDKATRVSFVLPSSGSGWVERVTAIVTVCRVGKTIDTTGANGSLDGTWRSKPRAFGDSSTARDGYWYGNNFATSGYLRAYRGADDDQAIEIASLRTAHTAAVKDAAEWKQLADGSRQRAAAASKDATERDVRAAASVAEARDIEAKIARLEGGGT